MELEGILRGEPVVVTFDRHESLVVILIGVQSTDGVYNKRQGLRGHAVGDVQSDLLLWLLNRAHAVYRNHRTILSDAVRHVNTDDIATNPALSGTLENLHRVEEIGTHAQFGE
jgi:hypothetical protein